jgi:hypothetical protein
MCEQARLLLLIVIMATAAAVIGASAIQIIHRDGIGRAGATSPGQGALHHRSASYRINSPVP